MKPGDLVYIPADIVLMKFDEIINDKDPSEIYIGPSPVSFHNLEKPTHALLLENDDNFTDDLVAVLYKGDKMYINKHDILPYQEEKWFS